jgi:DNA-binding NtrC family response regulator
VSETPWPLDVIATSRAMVELLRVVTRLSEARSTVMLQGESGTGKDLVAHLLHYGGARRNGPFIKVHCPSIPEGLLESELFGHERGAFTDAAATKLGKIEIASGGTLYFDQVQELNLALQAKLLRVIEERRFERLGGTRTIEVDVRFLSSTTVDLRDAVEAGAFRDDLYHRLSVVPLTLPPLRERREDIVPLANHFIRRAREHERVVVRAFDAAALDVLRGYRWPGNVRELRSVVERAMLFADNELITSAAFPPHVLEQPQALWTGRDRLPSLRDVEECYIRHVLEQVGGSQTRAAAVLGISRKSLWERRRRYGIP